MIGAEISRLKKALGYSRDGLTAAWRQDAPFRTEIVLSVIVVPLVIFLGSNGIERALLLGSWLLVPIVELLNCGLEAITDYATQQQRHDLAKKTKDVGSAAVLLAIIGFLVTWLMILTQ